MKYTVEFNPETREITIKDEDKDRLIYIGTYAARAGDIVYDILKHNGDSPLIHYKRLTGFGE